MKILKGKEKPWWVGKVLKCTKSACGCRFQLKKCDSEKLQDVLLDDCGGGYTVVPCPKCGENVIVA